jgi:LacI family transcriptional regulator
VVNRRLATGDLPHVLVDDSRGAAFGLEHLWELGHRRIAVVHGDPTWSTTQDRLKGVRAALRRYGTRLDPALLIPATTPEDGSEAAIVRLLQGAGRPTAMLAISNSATLAAIRALHRAAARCPDDVSLVGYGVCSPYSIPISSLSMIEQPVGAIAAAAVELLLAQIAREAPRASVVLSPKLTVGASSAPVSASAGRAPRRIVRVPQGGVRLT